MTETKQKKLLLTFCLILCGFVALVSLLCGCTISLNNVGTCGGTAEDVIDEEQTNTPDISPTIDIPLALPNLPQVPKVVVANKEKK
jgi:hypothetical protein